MHVHVTTGLNGGETLRGSGNNSNTIRCTLTTVVHPHMQ